MKRNKGFSGFLPLAIGLITLTVGVALLFILPEYIIGALNSTGIMSASVGGCYAYNTSAAQCPTAQATCCITSTMLQNANTNVATIRGIGMVVIIIGVIWVLMGMISGQKETGAM